MARTLTEPIGEAVQMLRRLWRWGYRYSQVSAVLDDLRAAATEPCSLFPTRDPAKSAQLMAALDAVNARYGRGALRPLATGLWRPASPGPGAGGTGAYGTAPPCGWRS